MINHDFYFHYLPLIKATSGSTYAAIGFNFERCDFDLSFPSVEEFGELLKEKAIQNWGLSANHPQFIKIVESLTLVDVVMVLTFKNDIDENQIENDVRGLLQPIYFDAVVNDSRTIYKLAPIFIANATSINFEL